MSQKNSSRLSRRAVLASAVGIPFLASCQTGRPFYGEDDGISALQALEASAGGRLGVSATNLQTGRSISWRGDERFAMCSTFKWLLGAFYAQRMRDNWSIEDEAQKERWDRFIPYTQADIVSYSPVSEPQLVNGGMTLEGLCEATIMTSDNTAANVLLKDIGGPEALTTFIRETGDLVTRLDRFEPELNIFVPGDERDTTTPNAMSGLMAHLLFGETGAFNATRRVHDWMIKANTGLKRLRAGISDDYLVGDKTGTNSDSHSNDVGFVYTHPVFKGMVGPVVISSYYNTDDPFNPASDEVHAEVGRIAMKALVGPLFDEQPWKA